jgi:two-component system LytT family sensor kinase
MKHSLYQLRYSRIIWRQSDKWKIVARHVLLWLVLWSADYLFAYGFQQGMTGIFPYIFNAFFNTVYFYTCAYFVILPYITRSKLLTIVLIVALLSITILIKFNIEKAFNTKYYRVILAEGRSLIQYTSFEMWRFAYMTFFSFTYWFYLKSLNEERLRRHTEQLLLKGEIDFLKAQINPHFLFNTLNLIYSEVSEISEKAGKAILSLTHLMRFSVESTKHEAIPLEKELEALEEYLDLQKLRFSEGLCLAYEKEGNAIYYSIPPLSILSVVENAFKYGVISDPENPIRIAIQAHTHTFTFHCKNKIRTDFTDKETTAVGLGNLKRRLQMAFGKNMDLRVIKDSTYYETQLSIVWT